MDRLAQLPKPYDEMLTTGVSAASFPVEVFALWRLQNRPTGAESVILSLPNEQVRTRFPHLHRRLMG